MKLFIHLKSKEHKKLIKFNIDIKYIDFTDSFAKKVIF